MEDSPDEGSKRSECGIVARRRIGSGDSMSGMHGNYSDGTEGRCAAETRSLDRCNRERGDVDGGCGIARWQDAGNGPAGEHLDAAGNRRNGETNRWSFQRRAPAGLVARRSLDYVLRIS